jgi:hypothetical protein
LKANDLKKQQEFETDFSTWFRTKLKPTIDDNRRRYRMQLDDAEERESRGLSALPSTKSTSAVDRYVEKAILEYHGEPDAISFSAQTGAAMDVDQCVKWLDQVIKHRMEHTFPFAAWHVSSLTAGAVDGLEAALVSWRREAYTIKEKICTYTDGINPPQPVPEEVYRQFEGTAGFAETEEDKEIPSVDSWWIDQLKPGEDLLWDIKTPLLNLNMGQAALVKLDRSLDQITELAEQGVIDKVKPETLKKWQGLSADAINIDIGATLGSTDQVDMGDLNTISVWLWFEKVNSRWMVSFSIEGKVSLSKPKPVDDVFYNGRQVNLLPVILGTSKIKLWENSGRGIPETIAPVEDEWIDHRNNLNDMAKINVRGGRIRLNKNSDVDIDSLLNEEVFYANSGEAEFIPIGSVGDSMRAADAITADFNELIPVGMDSRQVVPKGVDKTLGALQMAMGSSNEKLSVSLLVRNITFLRPLLYIIAQMEIAWETDATILKLAGQKVTGEQNGKKVPFQVPTVQGEVDFRALDVAYQVQINAGLGSVPRQQKIGVLTNLYQLGKQAGIPVDAMKMFKQICVLSGFDAEQFIGEPTAAPGPEMKVALALDFGYLSNPQLLTPPQQQLLSMIMNSAGGMDVNLSAQPPKSLGGPQSPMDAAGAMMENMPPEGFMG